MNLPELGVGLTWFAGLEPALEANAGFIDVLEIEPQTFWRRAPGDLTSETGADQSQVVDLEVLRTLQANPIPKLMHGVGFPVGGTRPPQREALALLREMAIELNVPWVSEHLSFNQAATERGLHFTSFFLPPRQTLSGVIAAAESIRAMASRMPVPIAVETGVNYLHRRADELPDGEFVARVAEAADCGILLDLHNIWANQKNGRQSVDEFLGQLPLDRVWEIHLAGGSDHRGYWLDAHSGGMPQELFDIASSVVRRLPNLKAVIFEFFSAYLPSVGHGVFRSQLEQMHRLWDMRRSNLQLKAHGRTKAATESALKDPSPSPREWEDTLGTLVVGRDLATPLAAELKADPGVEIIREIIEQFRASMIVRTLRMSSRLIMLERGNGYFEALLADYWKEFPPQPFAFNEAEGFAEFLLRRDHQIPYLGDVVDYDRAMIQVTLEAQDRLVSFKVDPLPLLRALGAGRKPDLILYGSFEILLTADTTGAGSASASEMLVIH
jgi:uncharacterized protein (UPF0276 family)